MKLPAASGRGIIPIAATQLPATCTAILVQDCLNETTNYDIGYNNEQLAILSSVLCPLFLAVLFLLFAVRSLIRFFASLAAGLRLVCLFIDDKLTL